MPNWKKVIVSGSAAVLSSVTASFTGSLTGALIGTSSWAVSASQALTASRATSASYAATASYAQNITISGSINSASYIDFTTNYIIGTNEPAWKEGRVFYDSGSGALAVYNWEQDVTLNVGQESWLRARNQTGVTITNGTVVRLLGAIGDRPTITPAQATDQTNTFSLNNEIIGIATHDIETGTDGFVTTFGIVNGVNTAAFTAGDLIWVSQSAGQFTNVAPPPPIDKTFVGIVTRANVSNGSIFVTPNSPIHFHDISTVSASAYQMGDLWMYRSGSAGQANAWINTKALTGSYGISGSLNVNGSITGSLFGTASWASSATTAISANASDTVATIRSTTSANHFLTFVDSNNGAKAYEQVFTGNNIVYNPGTSTFGTVNISASSILSSAGFTGSLLGTSSWASSASFASTASNLSPAISNDGDTRITTANGNGTLNAESLLTFDGTKLNVLYQSGDEGGEILLNKSVTNNSLTGSGITIDSYQNKIRFFEQGGAARGAYIDLTACAGGVGTNLLSGGGGATFNGGTNVDNRLVTATGTTPELNGEGNLTFDGSTLAVTGSALITGSLRVTGSLIASGTYGGINTFVNKPNLFDINGITRVQWSNGYLNNTAGDTTLDWEINNLIDSAVTTVLDWENKILYDSAGANSIDWTNRTLSETTNAWVALDYSNDTYLNSQLYYRNVIPGQVQRAVADTPAYGGQVIQATVDVGVTDFQLVFLDTDGIWKATKATVANGAAKMLGICVDQAGGYVLIEGDVGVSDDNSQGAYVIGADHGLPAYVSATTGVMTTTAPSSAGELVRIVGHIYYQSTSDVNWWTMKFRPSNDWYEI
jgi:hypothetical protein